MIETLLTARLRTITANVYPNVAPQNYATPCAVYQRLDTDTIRDLGDDDQEEGYVTFQIAVSSPLFSEAKTLARSIRRSLKAWNDTDVQTVAWINEHVMIDDTTEAQLHRVLLFFKFYTTAL